MPKRIRQFSQKLIAFPLVCLLAWLPALAGAQDRADGRESQQQDTQADLSEAWDELKPLREHREASLEVKAGKPGLCCEVDRFATRQVLRNILDNALAACDDPVEIEAQFSEVETNGRPGVRVSLCDNGPGLTPEEKERIFEPFFTTKTQGTGLGMVIAKRIVEAHGGEIAVGPGLGRGTEILLTLPRKQV